MPSSCGKGPEAAALTSLARYTLRALARRDPAVVLSLLNQMVVRDPALIPNEFVTVLFAVASRSAGSLSVDIATAGHPAPLVLRSDGAVERVGVAGPLVGLAALVGRGRGLDAEHLAELLEQQATGGQDPRDDIAILLVEVAGRGVDPGIRRAAAASRSGPRS